MFTGIIESILLHHVGKYLNGLQKNSFNVGLIDGQITIQNIGLNNTLFDELEIPLTLKFSNIQKIHIEVPWTKLDEKPTIVNIEGINILLDLSELKSLTESTIAFKFEQIISKIKKELEPKQEKEKDKKDKKKEGFAERSLIRILDNVDLTLRNLHVRFQDNSSFKNHRFSFGAVVKELMFHTTNKDGYKVFYRRSFSKGVVNPPVYRELKATQLQAYWNSEQTVFVKEVVQAGADREHILQFMKMPFPHGKQDTSKQGKKEKQPDFFKDLFKTKGEKEKEKEKNQQLKIRYEEYKKSMTRMKFHPICDMIITVETTQNDLNDKQKPLVESKVWIQPIKVEVGELMISQLLCLLEYYLKYTQDLFYYENKTKKGGMGNSVKHKKIFNDVMQQIFKKLPKIKNMSQIPKHTFKTKQDQEIFNEILDLQSVKNLRNFANDFVAELKLKKQIEKAEKNLKKKQKANEDIQKLMEKTKITDGDFQQIQIDYKGRVLIDLDCEIGGVSIKINQQKDNSVTESIRLILPLTKFFLNFVNQNNFSSKITSKDLLLDYSSIHKYLDLHNNQHDDFINIEFKKKGKLMTLDAKIQKKQFTFPQNLIAFVIKFIEPIRITPFFLNLFQQSTNIDSEAARSIIDGLMSIVPNMKSHIEIDLPKVEIQLKNSGIVVDCGKLVVDVPHEGCYQIPLKLTGMNVQLLNGESRTQFVPQINTSIDFIREFKESQHQDCIRFNFDKVEIIVPEVDIFDKLTTEIFQLTKDILKKELHLIDRKKVRISESIALNSHPESHPLYLLGEMLEISYPTPKYILLYQTIAYPLTVKNKHYVVLLRKRRVNYFEVSSEKEMISIIQLLNEHIEALSTITQLKNIWFINSKYESNSSIISKNADKLMTFVCESESSDVLLSQVDVNVHVQKLFAKFSDILIEASEINYKHVEYNQMGEDKLTVKNVALFIKQQKFICGISPDSCFLQLNSTQIISQRLDVSLSGVAVFLTHQNVSPLLQSIHQILKTTILREALTFDTQITVRHCRQFFNILQLESSVKMKQLQCSIMDCAGFIAQNLQIKSKLQSNSQQVILAIEAMDIFEMMKFNQLQLKRIMMVDLQNILEIKYKSLLIEMSPELLVRYLAILESNKEAILSHYETILQVSKFIQQASYFITATQTNQKISVVGSNIQLQIVQSQQNILQILVHQFMFQLTISNNLTHYILSFMEVSVNQQKSNYAIPVIKNFSVILKSNIKGNKNNISLAVTKLEVMVGIYILDYMYRILKVLHTVFLRNQWIIKFISNVAKEDKQISSIVDALASDEISVNLQLDQIGVLYIRNDNIPYLKLKIKINQSVLDIGKEIGLQVGVNISLLYFNNAIKIFEPIIEPVQFQTSYSKSTRLQSLKIFTKTLRINVSSESISQTILSLEQLYEFLRKYKDSFEQIIDTVTRIKQNKVLIIQKQEGRIRSPSKHKEDFTKGFTIRNFKQPRSVEPSNHLSIINFSGTFVNINLIGNELDLHADLANKMQQIVPIKIKSEYKHNYQILERVRCFKMLLDIDKHEHEVNFSISKIMNEKIQLPDGKYVRLKAVIDNEGMSIFIIGKIKIINSTPQKFVVKVGVDFVEEIQENSELYLPYYTDDEFKLSMLSSSGVSIPISNKQTFQQLEFVTFSSDHHTILLTSEIKNDEVIYRLTDSMRIFNHFDFKLEFRLDDTGFILPPNSITSTSKTSLKQVKNVELNIPSIGKWISIPINKLSMKEKELDYPLEKEQIKIYMILSKSKMGRLIHIYPRLAITNLTPYKLTLFTSLYQSLFVVNKKLKDQADQKPSLQHIKGFTIDYQQQNDCFILDEERYLHLALSNSKQKSEEFIGYDSDFNRTVDVKDEYYQYKIKVTYESVFLTEQISIFKANFKPKLYFVNKSDHEVKIHDWTVKPNHLIPFAFSLSSPNLQLQLDYEGINYKLITTVQLHSDNRWSLLLVQQEKEKDKLSVFEDFQVLRFGIQLIFKQGFGYFVFSRNTQYVVINNTLEQRRLMIVDDSQIKIRYEIPVGEKRKYYYRNQTINIQILGQQNEVVEDVVINLNQPINTDLQSCSISTYFEHLDRVITFNDGAEESPTFFSQEHGKPQRMLSLGIDEVSVSFVFYNFNEVRCETMYLKITQTNFLQIEYEKIMMLEFKSKNLILISKQIHQINQILSKQNTTRQFLNLYVEIPKERNIILSFKLEISPIRVCVSDELLELVLFNVDKLGLFKESSVEEKNKQFQIFFEFYNKTREQKVGDKILWKVVNLTIKQIEFEVEFKKCFIKGNRQRLKSFGFSLAQLKANKLSLSKLEINNSEQSISQFGKAIINQYKKQIISIIGGVLGGLNIIGNPRQFVLEIQSSVSQSNPGIIRGTGGFFKGVAVGTMNSVSKITGVVGNGLNLLSLDEKYMEERQLIKNRSITTAGQGFKAGASSFIKGLESGITGLVTQPVRGLQEQGVFGIFKGSLKGVVGLFTKPVVGALDVASMTTQGLTSVTKSTKQQEMIHERIRPLYYQRKIIRPQCDVEETCCLFLDKYFPQFYAEMKLVQTFLLEQEQDPQTLTSILVLTLSQLMVIDILSKQVTLKIKNQHMSAVGKFTEGVVLYYSDEQDDEIEMILRLKRSNELKHLLYLSLQKMIETFRVGQ